ncbi:hypothetical protein CRG98_037648 [Punica granatum]|uniref:Uncharacterized protein n=1 Tax=Punica granatum TaxID=22663 RepID=A0A2I0ID89_PUNGR|nr:hypothetical protein CRG98_037648 [Punica granatum]
MMSDQRTTEKPINNVQIQFHAYRRCASPLFLGSSRNFSSDYRNTGYVFVYVMRMERAFCVSFHIPGVCELENEGSSAIRSCAEIHGDGRTFLEAD